MRFLHLKKPRLFAPLFLITPLLILSASLTSAQPTADKKTSDILASQRYHYQKAKVALARNHQDEFTAHLQELDTYPLKQYLEFAQLRRQFDENPFAEIDRFLSHYEGSFLESRLRANLLVYLASRENWNEFLKYYREELSSVSLRCHYLHALVKTGHTTALEEAAELWNVGKSQPKACDPLFETWQAAGQMTDERILQRFYKAMQANETRFARYLSRQLKSPESIASATVLLSVHGNPALVKQQDRFREHDLATQNAISHGIQRLAKKAPLEALYHWELYEAKQIFPQHMIRDTKLTIVKRLIRSGHSTEAYKLLKNSQTLRKQNLVEELAREALTEQDWERLAATMEFLSEENKASDRWQYWAARVQEETQKPLPGFSLPKDIYRSIAQNRSFYGFLSADKQGLNYSLVDDSASIAAELLNEVAKLDGMQRAHELWLTGNLTEAKAEWIHLSQQLDTQQLLAAGQLARSWGWYNTGIQAMISGNFWNQLTVRFPLAYQDEIYRVAQNTQVEPTFIYAIARQESAFDESAKSPVGAMGLMQLMPQTARYTAQARGVKHQRNNQLLDVEHNMLLGSHYLNLLLEKFDGNRVLAAAAYNAGPHRVNRWLSEEGKERPVDVWIETIPFKETRHYVQNVLCFSVIYAYRLGVQTTFISEKEAKRFL